MNQEEIKKEIDNCLGCVNKNCQKGCPLSNDITEAIDLIKKNEYEKAYEKFLDTSVLLPICGRICPHGKQCEGKCIKNIKGKSVNIGDIEAFLGDLWLDSNTEIKNFPEYNFVDKKVAIIGSGPSGITCAATLKRFGVKEVVIYEKHSYMGGLLNHGIPNFRLEDEIVDKTYNKILDLGIIVEYNKTLQENIILNDLEKEYDAIFIACGANASSKMNIEGENLEFVYGGNELLENKELPDVSEKSIVVIGGGNVAMDVSRTLKRARAKSVKILYRRTREQMPAEEKEINDTIKDSIEIIYNTNILRIFGEGKVECIKTRLVEEEGKRPYPVNIEGTNYVEDTDMVVMAVGSNPEESVISSLGLNLNKWGYIEVDENYKTSKKNIFAGGDIIGTKSTVAYASVNGREAAKSIYKYLCEL